MKGLVGGLRPGPPVPPLKSGPDGTGSIKIRKTATKYPLIDILILGDDSSERTGEDRPAAGLLQQRRYHGDGPRGPDDVVDEQDWTAAQHQSGADLERAVEVAAAVVVVLAALLRRVVVGVDDGRRERQTEPLRQTSGQVWNQTSVPRRRNARDPAGQLRRPPRRPVGDHPRHLVHQFVAEVAGCLVLLDEVSPPGVHPVGKNASRLGEARRRQNLRQEPVAGKLIIGWRFLLTDEFL